MCRFESGRRYFFTVNRYDLNLRRSLVVTGYAVSIEWRRSAMRINVVRLSRGVAVLNPLLQASYGSAIHDKAVV